VICIEPRHDGRSLSVNFLLSQDAVDSIFAGTVPPKPRVTITGTARDGIVITPSPGDTGIHMRPRKTGWQLVGGWHRLGFAKDFQPVDVGYQATPHGIVIEPLPAQAAQAPAPENLPAVVVDNAGQITIARDEWERLLADAHRERRTVKQPVPTAALKRLKLMLLDINDLVAEHGGAIRLKVNHEGKLTATALRVAEMEI
jgi:hypothetical protein